jgi:formamidopyrimidine-DNA glycosylase
MPELPEVETVMHGLKPHLEGAVINDVVVRYHQLRWPIPSTLHRDLCQQRVKELTRRGKYLLMRVETGTLIMHLGMSGSLRIVSSMTPINKHDHVDIIFSNQNIMRYTDPRRFGALLWTVDDPYDHVLLKSQGVEPLDSDFTADYLKERACSRRIAIKPFIMDSNIVVGIGNIYAAEALFLAGIYPATPAGLLTQLQYQKLVKSIKQVLQSAIKQGGTTVKDFMNSEGKPGYFTQQLTVYGRAGLPCVRCHASLCSFNLGQRSTVFCVNCQPLTGL